jgi:hypothetical protein
MLCPQQRETSSKITTIKPGMSLHDIEAILGPPRPPNNPYAFVVDLYGGGILMCPGHILEWWFESYVVQVVLDENGKAIFVRFLPVLELDDNPLQF